MVRQRLYLVFTDKPSRIQRVDVVREVSRWQDLTPTHYTMLSFIYSWKFTEKFHYRIIFCIVMINATVHVLLSTTVVQFVVADNSRICHFANNRVYCANEICKHPRTHNPYRIQTR